MDKPTIVQALAPGVYWYQEKTGSVEICEKREGEHFVRFTNGSGQSWIHEGARFLGPLQKPEAVICSQADSTELRQREALASLRSAIDQATQSGLFDEMAAHGHPDRINAFCDDVADFAEAQTTAHRER